MKKVLTLWHAISAMGLEDGDNSRHARQVKVTNRIALLAGVFLMPHILTYVEEGLYLPAMIQALTTSLIFGALLMSERRWYLTAKVTLICVSALNTLITITYLGYSSGEHFAFFIITLGAAMMFDPEHERKHLIGFLVFLGMCLVVLTVLSFDPLGIHAGALRPTTDYIFNLFVSFVIISFFGLHFQNVSNEQADGLILQAKQEMEAAFDHSYDAIFLVDPDTGMITGSNARSEELFDTAKDALDGQPLTSIFRKAPERNFLLKTSSRLQRGETWTEEEKFKKFTNGWFWGNVAYTFIRAGQEERLMVRITDVTLAKQSQFELERSKNLAESANIAKAHFLANMSHEIRTPINGIIGLSSILPDLYEGDQELEEYSSLIKVSGERLLRTLDSVLALSQLESSINSLNWQIHDLRELSCPVLDNFTEEAEDRGISLRCEVSQGISLQTDGAWFHKVLDHLVSNAIKFTEKGSVTVSATVLSGGEVPNVILDVTDTGIGMSEEFIREKLFKKFAQESEGLDRNFEGAGLGLSIVKRVIEILGGEIEVFSERHSGTTFRVILPQVQHELPSLLP